MNISKVQERLALFATERDWDQFHSPKNLTMALSGEVGELVEIFQWLTEEQSKNLSEKDKQKVSEELADVMIYLLRLADKLGIDIDEAVTGKIEINDSKYPVNLSKGNATKYNRRE